ncbi:hypothetical protein PoB_001548500 [Plakobranchus ocellatus]|uniref:Uncharacterized protein n=1 Tax=Plakobranchus ocellatus TaxID=259542 RepID=A0AAV3Z1C4_9GAST|nr:hypothetical protein PoB_001548500 [Plakobranchus ocellatus]
MLSEVSPSLCGPKQDSGQSMNERARQGASDPIIRTGGTHVTRERPDSASQQQGEESEGNGRADSSNNWFSHH